MSDVIKEGSVVQLKSGGPSMTVTSVEEIVGVMYAYCEWFVQDEAPWKRDNASYPMSSLKLLEP